MIAKKPALERPRGTRPVLQNIVIEDLAVDPAYQRAAGASSSQQLIARIARAWDWTLCLPLVVNRRRDGPDGGGGGLFVIDGQHRLLAARRRPDIFDLPCVVLDLPSAAAEARLFQALNRERRPLAALDVFKAALAEQDAEALRIDSLLRRAGLRIAPHTNFTAWKPGQIANISGIRQALKAHGEPAVQGALMALAGAFGGQVLRYGGTIFPGAAHALANPPSALGPDVDLLAAVLEGQSQAEWAAEIGALASSAGIHWRHASAQVIGTAFAEAAEAMLDDDEDLAA